MLLRRLLLAWVTGLVVAQPLIPAEDPGMLAPVADPSALILPMLWLLAAAGWAVWGTLALSWNANTRTGSAVGIALAVLTALGFLSAGLAAPYKHPAYLIAWQTLGLFLTFFVVHRLARSPEEQNGLFAALLAGGVAVAAHAVYQAALERPFLLPRLTGAISTPGKLAPVTGTYALPGSLAAFLVLLLPALAAAVLITFRSAPTWQRLLAVLFTLVAAAALWLSRSLSGIQAIVLVGMFFVFASWRLFPSRHRPLALAGLVLVAFGASALYLPGRGSDPQRVGQLLGTWRTTWTMIGEKAWLGYGPGNFGRAYLRFMAPSDAVATDPHNFILNAWVNTGTFAALALVVALALFFVRILRGLRLEAPAYSARAAKVSPVPGLVPINWEFYLGGMFGLILAFFLRVGGPVRGSVVPEAWAAGVRALFWFSAFGLFERVAWTGRVRATALAAGVAALLLHLFVSEGIGFPSVAGPLWVAVALALNALPPLPGPPGILSGPGRERLLATLALPITLAVATGYGFYFLGPTFNACRLTQIALHNGEALREGEEKPTFEDLRVLVVEPLRQARHEDASNAWRQVHLARWEGALWQTIPNRRQKEAEQLAVETINLCRRAQFLDPEGLEGYVEEVRLRRMLADFLHQYDRGQEHAQLIEAARTLEKGLANDPTSPTLHFEMAALWDRLGGFLANRQKEHARRKNREQAELARTLNEQVVPARRLTDRQEAQLRAWIGAGGR